jgi:hypothetical protein
VEGCFREEACVVWKTIGILFVVSLDPQAFDVLYVLVEVSDFDCVTFNGLRVLLFDIARKYHPFPKSFAFHVLSFSFSE